MVEAVQIQPSLLPPGDPAWLALLNEDVLEPDLPIVDPHHHLWGPPRTSYLAKEFGADMGCGHNVVGSVFVDCMEGYRKDGSDELRPVGETEFVVGVAKELAAQSPRYRNACAGIVSRVDLLLGAGVEAPLDAHIEAGEGRFRGVRFSTAWDPNPDVRSTARTPPAGLLLEPAVAEGARVLARKGLILDLWLYFHQLDDVVCFAKAVPEVSIVLDHLGGPVFIGPYASKKDEVFAQWREGLARVAECENVQIKLGGLGMHLLGFGFEKLPTPPTSEMLADAWRPLVEPAIELFGPDRAMFESNFPVDGLSCSYKTFWNALKRMVAGSSESDKKKLFSGTAAETYSISTAL